MKDKHLKNKTVNFNQYKAMRMSDPRRGVPRGFLMCNRFRKKKANGGDSARINTRRPVMVGERWY